jgi:hypothetical protein
VKPWPAALAPLRQDLYVSVRSIHADLLPTSDQPGGLLNTYDGRHAAARSSGMTIPKRVRWGLRADRPDRLPRDWPPHLPVTLKPNGMRSLGQTVDAASFGRAGILATTGPLVDIRVLNSKLHKWGNLHPS